MSHWWYSPLIEGAFEGRLVHLAGVDVIGSTAGSLARVFQDREAELWEGKRIVAHADKEEVCEVYFTPTYGPLTVIPCYRLRQENFPSHIVRSG